MKLYNTLTRSKDGFAPVKKGSVGIYSCGPTVYWNQHIGHMYAYVQWDILVRTLRYLGNKVKWVMNITDVGHMTSDEDTGEDKMEKGAKREGLTVWEIAEKYMAQFVDSMELLNISKPDVLCRATEHIDDQIKLVKKIEENGYAYETKMGLVFDTANFIGYADFAKLDLKKQEKKSDVATDPEKKNPHDFFLWVKDPKHVMHWNSPWGVGYPGWHIECTAMSTKYLGEKFDIHTGGIEHIPVHHTNEIAQGYGAYGDKTANYWLHNSWLKAEGGEKMSKSLGNFVTTQDLQKKGYDPLALRYLIITSHYRKGVNFSWDALDYAQNTLGNLRKLTMQYKYRNERTTLSEEKRKKIEDYTAEFTKNMEDDLNTPKALAVMWKMLKSNIPSIDKYDLILSFDEVLGLNLRNVERLGVPNDVMELARKRTDLRSEGKYEESDKVREEILKKGFIIKDTPGGYELEPSKKQ